MNGHVFLVHQFLERAARDRPDHPFLVEPALGPNAVATYGEVDRGANRVARRLVGRHDLRSGERVAILAPNSREYVEAYYGILKAGAIAVPLSVGATAAEVALLVADCGARLVVAAGRSMKLAAGLDGVQCVTLADAAEESSEPLALTRDSIDLDPCTIAYTSGTTGRPRGATLSHRNLVANIESIVDSLGLSSDDRGLALLPFHYVYGKSVLNMHVAVGATLVLEPRFAYPNVALDTLEEQRCTGLSGVPSTFAILLHRSNLRDRAIPALRYITQAGGGMSPGLTRELLDALPGKSVFVMYGATEAAARLSCLSPSDVTRKLGSIGKPIRNVELRIDAPDGEVGEILARGSNIMLGYWNDPAETALVLADGWYRTGDLGRRDDEGFFYVEGRLKDMLKVGGQRVAAKQLEEAILACEAPAVLEAAVVGVPDEVLGEAPHAYVVFRDQAETDTSELARHLKAVLPHALCPTAIEVMSSLPKNASGKVMKSALRRVTE